MNKKVLVKFIIFLSFCLSVGNVHAQQPTEKLIIQKTPVIKPQLTAKEEYFSFNPASTVVVNKGGNWVIVDKTKPNLIVASFGGNQKADADRALDIIKKYGINQICYVKPGVPFQYGLVSGQPPTGTYPDEVCRNFNPNTVAAANIQGRWKIVEGSNVIFDFGTNESQAKLVLGVIKKHGFTRSCSVGRPPGFHYMAKHTEAPKPAAQAPPPKVIQTIKPPIKPVDIKTYSPPTKITITSPAKNSTWYTQSNLSIQWKATPSPGIFHILLVTPGVPDTSPVLEIATSKKMQPDQQGIFKYTWQIPPHIKPGDYVVKVIDANQPGVPYKSEIFKISPRIPAKVEIADKKIGAPKSVVSITVRSPAKNSTYHPGLHTLPIEWKAVGQMSNQVKIVLYPAGQPHLADAGQGIEIVKNAANNGKFDWPIPSNSRTGKFAVRVQTTDNKVKGDSEGFNIQSNRGPDEKGLYTKSVTVTSPEEGEKWDLEGTYTVKWHAVRFPSDTPVRIIACYFGANTCCDEQLKNSTWQEIGRANIYAGSYTYKVRAGLYIRGLARIMVMVEYGMGMDLTEAGKYGLFGYSGVIQIGEPKITVTSPSKGETWVPLKPYTVKWDISGISIWLYSGTQWPSHVNIWLDQKNDLNRKNSILLAKRVLTPFTSLTPGTTIENFSGTYTGILGNVPSGDYRVRVEQSNNPYLYASSLPITVKSSMDPNTIVIGPQSSEDEVDLALLEVFFDGIDMGYLTARIRNLGGDFKGSIKFDYEFEKFVHESDNLYGVTENKIIGTVDKAVEFKALETKTVPFLYWENFDYIRWPTHYENYFIPKSGPWKGKVTITPSKKDSNPANNKIETVKLCKTLKADIGTMGFIRFFFTSRDVTIHHGTQNGVNASDMKWISDDKFEAELEVVLWNYGCLERTFYCSLYVDDLPGQVLWQLTLTPGERRTIKGLFNIKVPFKYGPHQLVFIADGDESKDQGYPNSYKNNVIVTTLTIFPF